MERVEEIVSRVLTRYGVMNPPRIGDPSRA